jgi:tetratricopeptide (TPR) repeat protein
MVATAVAAAGALVGLVVALLMVSNAQLREKEAETRTALGQANENAKRAEANEEKAKENAKRAEANAEQAKAERKKAEANEQRARRNARMVRKALKDVTLQVAEERLLRDPNFQPIARNIVDQSVKLNEDLSREDDEDLEVLKEAAFDFRYSAGLYKRMGIYDRAQQVYRRSLELFEKFEKQQPGDFGCRFNLASCYREVGDMYRDLGKRAEAATAYRQSLGVWARPAPMNPCPFEGAWAHGGLGALLAAEGKWAEAVDHLRRAIALRRPRGVPFPDQPWNLFDLAVWHRILGLSLQACGALDTAEAQYRQAFEQADRLVRERGNDLVSMQELTQSCFLRGALREEGQPREAEKFYLRALDQLAKLSEARPGIPEFRQWLADAHVRLGVLAWGRRDTAEAGKHFRQARDLLEKLAADAPGGGPGMGAPGANEKALAWFLAMCPDEGFRDPRRAVELARKAVERAPARWDYWNTLGVACYRAGKLDEAVAALDKAAGLHPEGDRPLGFILALAHHRRGDTNKAHAYFEDAVAWVERHKALGWDSRLLRNEATALLAGPAGPLAAPQPQGPPRQEAGPASGG